MIIESVSPSLMLAAGELVRLPADARATIVCAQGSVWVTRDGDLQDIVLSRGDSLDLRDGAATLVQAFEPSLLQVREGAAPVPRRAAAGRLGMVDVGAAITSVVSRRGAAWRSTTGACQA